MGSARFGTKYASCYASSMSASILDLAAAVARREQLLVRRPRCGDPMPDLPDKLSALEAAAAAFSASNIDYALIGGLAVGIRSGVPRATLDVDFAVPSEFNKPGLTQAFAVQAFVLTGEFAHSINFKHRSGEPVQVAFDPGFDAMIQRAQLMRFGDLELRVVTTEDLIAMKRRAAADPKRRRSKALRDQADIAILEGDVPEPDEGW
jgi:hypothetical protein